jgi:hypothetical protein
VFEPLVATSWQAEGHCRFIVFRSGAVVVFEGCLAGCDTTIVEFKVLSRGMCEPRSGICKRKDAVEP